jgi:hypothetical protein
LRQRVSTVVLFLAFGLVANALATLAGASPGSAPASAALAPEPLRISVLSNRADLISDGQALVEIQLPRGVRARQVRVWIGTREVTRSFALRPDGRFEGLASGLRLGRNVLRATAPGYAGRVVITNHRNGGPAFSGPQLGPYVCQAGAKNKRCDQPASYTWLYKSTNPLKAGLQPYDRKNPPSDVATTTTDRGVTVPFVVRKESGFQDRDRYTILTLFRPGKGWAPWRPQKQWNHKLLITHGGGCGASYTPGEPPVADLSGTIPLDIPGYQQSYLVALGRGFAVVSTALDNTGHNCNEAMQAESLMMAKERLVERYGRIRYTIGTGCSGGSIAQQTVANTYPGIYQGLVTTCSYPDSISPGAQFVDYHLMRLYFEHPETWAPGVIWSPTQMAATEGHLSILNSITADEGLLKAAINPETACPGTKDPVAGDRSTRFDHTTNPGGVRCSILDMMRNPLGVRPKSAWSPQEKAAGHGFAGIPIGNEGVQYGLRTLLDGGITPAQFVDLNVKAGGFDINALHTAARLHADPGAVRNMYRTGMIDEATNLQSVAIINHGGPDPGVAHDYAHAYWTEARLRRAQGGRTPNRVMWFGETPLIGDPSWPVEAMLAMDRWLHRVEGDHRSVSLARKIGQDRPADVHDRCTNLPGFDLVVLPTGEKVCEMPALQTRLDTPRMVAGDNVTNDRLVCALRPMDRTSYGSVVFTDDQWTALQAVFPDGVCDWSKPGYGQRPAETWLRYADDTGRVVYGGTSLPAPPVSSGGGWMSAAFRPLWNE